MSCLKKSGLLLLALGLLVCLALPAQAKKVRPVKADAPKTAVIQPLKFVSGSWTIVLLPDVQYYSRIYPGLYSLQTSWIVKNKQKQNIQYVLTLGDITDGNTPLEWEQARDAMSNLDSHVPYAMVMGNHDFSGCRPGSTDRDTPMNKYFPLSLFKDQPTFGGVMKANRLENAYYLFSAGGSDWIVVALEWAPRDETVAWANSVLDKYPQRKAILVTHAYMYSDNTRYDYAKTARSRRGIRTVTHRPEQSTTAKNCGTNWSKSTTSSSSSTGTCSTPARVS